MIDGTTIRAVEAAYNIGLPLDADAVLLIEVGTDRKRGLTSSNRCSRIFASSTGHGKYALPRTNKSAPTFGKPRKNALGALGRLAPNYYIQDGVVPRSKLPFVLQQQDAIAKKYNVTIANVLHAGRRQFAPEHFVLMRAKRARMNA